MKNKNIPSLIFSALLVVALDSSASNSTILIRGNSFEWVGYDHGMKWLSQEKTFNYAKNSNVDINGTTHIKWNFNPAYSDTKITSSQALEVIKTAMLNWESVCNIRFEYQGTTNASPASHGDGISSIGFVPVGSMGNAAANGETQSYGGILNDGSKTAFFTEADMMFPTSFTKLTGYSSQAYLAFQGVATHELGHFLGLQHSDKTDAIMYANPYHDPIYEATIRQDDVDGCVQMYGQPLNPNPFAFTTLDGSAQATTTAPLKLTSDMVSLKDVPGYYQDIFGPGSLLGHSVTVSFRTGVVPDGMYRYVFALFNGMYFAYNSVARSWTYIPDIKYAQGQQAESTVISSNGFTTPVFFEYPSGAGLIGTRVFVGYGKTFSSMISDVTYTQFHIVID